MAIGVEPVSHLGKALSMRFRSIHVTTRLIAACTMVVAAIGSLWVTPVSSMPASAASTAWIDATNADAVLDLYDRVWAPQSPSVGWTGNAESCTAGTTSSTMRNATIERINAYRSLVGVTADIAENPAFTQAAQAAAMLMAANNSLSHSPPPSWRCYSDLAASGASRSNLYLGRFGVGAIDGYVVDPGANNAAVGHRWWIMRPGLDEMGVGSTDRSHALYVVSPESSSTTRHPGGDVAWPTAGFTPEPLMPRRWSLMNDATEFSSATVEVRDGSGAIVPTDIEFREFGRIVFVPDLVNAPDLGERQSRTYNVTVTTPTSTHSYTASVLGVRTEPETQPDPQPDPRPDPTESFRFNVPEAVGGRTVIAQLTVARVDDRGFVTAYECSEGLPADSSGRVSRADLNYDGRVQTVESNRLVAAADDAGDLCFHTSTDAELVVDIVGTTSAIDSTDVERTDTRIPGHPFISGAGSVLRVRVPAAAGRRTVVGQVGVARADSRGFVTAYACSSGIPRRSDGSIERSDLNYDGRIRPVASNRLIVTADDSGDLCLYTSSKVELIVDVNGVTDAITELENDRLDTRATGVRTRAGAGVSFPIPAAAGAKTVIGQVTVTGVSDRGFVTAYGCADGLPVRSDGQIDKSDLNIDGRVQSAVSNRLTVTADEAGEICLHTTVDAFFVVDVFGVTDAIEPAQRRFDTR